MSLVAVPPGHDLTADIVAQVQAACAAGTPLRIVGGDTKRFYGRVVAAEPLAVAGHHGVLRYDPAELVLTARAGTRLSEIEDLLARHGQRLPFEPPAFGAAATLGGTVAAGLAGPARAARGPVRDYVLGARLLAGDGRVLKFGGEVMKNVAGYDVARLLAGSLGVLGVLLEVSLKVLPAPPASRTLRRTLDAQAALALLAARARSLPLSASFWHAGELHLRLEGSVAALDEIVPAIGGTLLEPDEADAWWGAVREQRHPYFTTGGALWRLSLPTTTAGAAQLRADRLAYEWNGAQAWLAGVDRATVELVARTAGGHATLFRRDAAADDGAGEVFAPLPPALLELHRSVKRVLDPAGILNPGRMYADL